MGHRVAIDAEARAPDQHHRDCRQLLVRAATGIHLPISDKVRINRVEYGEGPQQFTTDDLRDCELEDDWSLLTERTPATPIRLPHRFVASCTKRFGRTAVVHIVTDIPYVQAVRPFQLRSSFVARCKMDRAGILPFVDLPAYHDGRIVVRSDAGAVGIVVAVEYRGDRPVARSRYVAGIRAGIRYPDDVWRSTRTGSAILSSPHAEMARVAFQSRQEGGLSSDVFVCDVDGGAMVNLTRKSMNSYDGLFRGREEVAEWVDRSHLRVASALAPQDGVRIVEDPARARRAALR